MDFPLKSPCSIGNFTAPNRFFAQPVEKNQAQANGCFTPILIDRYKQLRNGGWGIINLESTAISPQEKFRERALILEDTPENEESWTYFFKEMKQKNNETIWLLQISAAAHKNVNSQAKTLYSGQQELPHGDVYTTEELEDILDQFITATRLAYERGADGIDFKMCHGYFGGLFLRPNNLRDDKYGGAFENRTRFLREYMEGAKKEISDKNFLWTTRINAWDAAIPGGFGMASHKNDEAGKGWIPSDVEVFKLYNLLDTLGFDLIDISSGLPTLQGIMELSHSIHPYFTMQQQLALKAKNYLKSINSSIKIAATGYSALGPYLPRIATAYLTEGIDFVGIGRWQICEPRLPELVLSQRTLMDMQENLEENANICIACGKCFQGLHGLGPVECAIHDISCE